MSVFDEVAAIAADAHGCVVLSQLRRAGLTDGRIRTLVRTGFLHRRGAGLFTVVGAPATWRQEVMVEVLRGGPQAVSSHRSAAALAALDRFRPGAIDVVSPRGGRRSSPSAHLHETYDLPGRDRDALDGIPVTSVTRTLIDMGRYVGAHRLGSMLDDAVRRKLTTYERVHDRFRELARPGRNGIGRMRAVLEDRPCGAPAPGSDFETMVLRLLRQARLPEPVLQHRVQCDDLHFLLDLAWPDHMLAVECEGHAYHQTPTQLAWDEMRKNRLQLEGWTVLAYTWITARRDPDGLVSEVAAGLR
ncbi:hypothetical protein [Dermatobacter hominis]|uniref:hypothetical protein n=1 Tax=Dermatobacter hominis TaxID=2884263 RepID=UPI001D11E232|nr:hypothetical protein [Dermatobacter hominis]UDY38112.1 hypothetical protein LH044_12610 [Dermatobacter hominis]